MKYLLTLGLICFSIGSAAACPYTEGGRKQFVRSATELYSPLTIDLVAGGPDDLSACPEMQTIGAVGYAISEPDVEIQYTADAPYDLVFTTGSSSSEPCDTILLINDPAGDFVFNDDSEGADSMISFSSPDEGAYDVWVGTFGPAECDAALVVETFEPIEKR